MGTEQVDSPSLPIPSSPLGRVVLGWRWEAAIAGSRRGVTAQACYTENQNV